MMASVSSEILLPDNYVKLREPNEDSEFMRTFFF